MSYLQTYKAMWRVYQSISYLHVVISGRDAEVEVVISGRDAEVEESW